ncbi:MAG: acetate--CoA ligase family protein [Burkholderiales bacterium]|nr:acetate--CoA ligase family protein [Burkholderiales bacterium]
MNPLHRLFNPRSIAVVGASDRPNSIGARALDNLLVHSQFDGEVYLVSTSKAELFGRRCWPSVRDLPATPDVVMVVVPASATIEVLEQCADRGVAFAVVLTSGFGETGEEGLAVEAQMRAIAARSGMRIYGPNCPGVCNVNARLGMTFSPSFPHDLRPGPIGIATQGGGLGRNIMQAMERGIGVAMWSSSGNEVDLQVADFIDYMADAPDIKVIVTLIEGIKDGPRLVRALQKAARNDKPVVALKVGRSDYGARAAASHTASITGSAEVNSAALKQLGVIEVDDIDELVDTAWLLARQMPAFKPGGDAVAVYCGSGGAAALTADIIGQQGVKLAQFAPETTAALLAKLPSYAAVGNPVDTTTAVLSQPGLFDATLLDTCRDPNTALVVIPLAIDYGKVTDDTAEAVVRVQQQSPVPIVVIWMSDRLGKAFSTYAQAGIVPSRSVGKAVKAIRRWMDHGHWRQRSDRLDWQPWPTAGAAPAAGPATPLGEAEAKALLGAAGIAVPRSGLARTRDEALALAARIGFPVVAKVASADILHKTEVGGVAVGLHDAAAVGTAWDRIHASVRERAPQAVVQGLLVEQMAAAGGVEVLVGVSRDPVFGHVLTFGLGGIYVEVFKDVSRRLLPLTRAEAERLVREPRSFALLDGARGRPQADVAALVELLLKVSDFVGAHAQQIDEMDLNPVWVGPAGQGALALDAVIVGRLDTAAGGAA